MWLVQAVLGDYQWLTYKQVHERVKRVGLGIKSLGLKPNCIICIFAETRAEWIITALACFKFNFPGNFSGFPGFAF